MEIFKSKKDEQLEWLRILPSFSRERTSIESK